MQLYRLMPQRDLDAGQLNFEYQPLRCLTETSCDSSCHCGYCGGPGSCSQKSCEDDDSWIVIPIVVCVVFFVLVVAIIVWLCIRGDCAGGCYLSRHRLPNKVIPSGPVLQTEEQELAGITPQSSLTASTLPAIRTRAGDNELLLQNGKSNEYSAAGVFLPPATQYQPVPLAPLNSPNSHGGYQSVAALPRIQSVNRGQAPQRIQLPRLRPAVAAANAVPSAAQGDHLEKEGAGSNRSSKTTSPAQSPKESPKVPPKAADPQPVTLDIIAEESKPSTPAASVLNQENEQLTNSQTEAAAQSTNGSRETPPAAQDLEVEKACEV